MNMWNNVFDQRGQKVGLQINSGDDMPKGGNTTNTTKVWIDEVEGFVTDYIGLRPTGQLSWRGGDAGLPEVVMGLAGGNVMHVPSTAMEKLAEAWGAYLDARVTEGEPETEPMPDEDILVGLMEGVSLIIAQLGALDTRVADLEKLAVTVHETLGSVQGTLTTMTTPRHPNIVADNVLAIPALDEEQDVEVYRVTLYGSEVKYEHSPMVKLRSAVHLGMTSAEVEEVIAHDFVPNSWSSESGGIYVTKAAMSWFLNIFQSKPLDQWIAMHLDG